MNTTFTAHSITTDALPSYFSRAAKNLGSWSQGSVGCGTAGALGFLLKEFSAGFWFRSNHPLSIAWLKTFRSTISTLSAWTDARLSIAS